MLILNVSYSAPPTSLGNHFLYLYHVSPLGRCFPEVQKRVKTINKELRFGISEIFVNILGIKRGMFAKTNHCLGTGRMTGMSSLEFSDARTSC